MDIFKERVLALQQAKEELRDLLVKYGPKNENSCTVFESAKGNFYLATGGKTATGDMMYVINGHLWYDYDNDFMESKPWKPIYQKNGQE